VLRVTVPKAPFEYTPAGQTEELAGTAGAAARNKDRGAIRIMVWSPRAAISVYSKLLFF